MEAHAGVAREPPASDCLDDRSDGQDDQPFGWSADRSNRPWVISARAMSVDMRQ
ncbi:hypothetical protein [Piscinibacter sp. XHJ-5]|uniref:hypothetical protein n=1 Tax=Piscinibacter sp. XHJ-5 TaxID=3037797 RepID=UPI002452E4EC|nr:hypothetical protein [Piscinibacter sp. XHJ-5]